MITENDYVIRPRTRCWHWGRGLDYSTTRYGLTRVDGKVRVAHRVSYEQFVGPIPDGLFVLHKCDNRSCVNPEHLEIGTHADNMRQMVERGRSDSRLGERHHMTKLTEDDVRSILADTRIQREIAEDYGVSRECISSIKRGKNWSHISTVDRRGEQ